MTTPRLPLLGALAVGALALAGCGSDSGSDADATSGGDGAFPVSIKSSLGTAEIKRVA